MVDAQPALWTGGMVRALRHRRHLTQQAFAERIGVSAATVSKWENEKERPSPMACRALRALAMEAA